MSAERRAALCLGCTAVRLMATYVPSSGLHAIAALGDGPVVIPEYAAAWTELHEVCQVPYKTP